jgi:hypothetical protein
MPPRLKKKVCAKSAAPRRAHLRLERRLAKALKTPPNLSLMPLPPRAPELNPQENLRQFMRANWLSHRVFKSHDDIVDHCCYAWNTLIDQPWKIMSSRSAQHAHRPRQARQTSLGRAERPCR